MNIQDYIFKLPCPTKQDFNITWWYKNGVCIAKQKGQEDPVYLSEDNRPTLESCLKEKVVDMTSFANKKDIWFTLRNINEINFKDALFKDLGIENNPKREKLYQCCVRLWSNDSTDFLKIYEMAEHLVALIK